MFEKYLLVLVNSQTFSICKTTSSESLDLNFCKFLFSYQALKTFSVKYMLLLKFIVKSNVRYLLKIK
jgi:hypothetical protein